MENTSTEVTSGSVLSLDGLAFLWRDFPSHRIWEEAAGGRVRYVARALRLGVSPYAVVTSDLGELRAILASEGEDGSARCMNDPHDGTEPERDQECPQAIADDYPGWDIRCDDGQWSARCPTLTLRAPSAARLRAAIERAIGDEAGSDGL